MIEVKILAILLVTLKAESFIIIPYLIIWLTFTEILNKITKNFLSCSKFLFTIMGSEVFCKKDVFLEISQDSQEKTCDRASFFNRVVGLRPSKNFLRTTFLVTTFFQNTGRLLLKNNYQIFKNFFQIFLIYEFSFRRTGELFIDSLSFVYVEK